MIELLEWDSRFFGFSIAHLPTPAIESYDPKLLCSLAHKEGVALVQACVSSSRFDLISILESDGFRFVEIKVSLHRSPSIGCTSVRLAKEADLPALKNLAKTSFRIGRFFVPPFDPMNAGRFYSEWVGKAVAGTFDDFCLVSETGGEPSGFITLKYGTVSAQIGLLAVDSKFHHCGVGTNLLKTAESLSKSKGYDDITVVTQGHNYPALKFYQSAGYCVQSTEIWLYKTMPA